MVLRVCHRTVAAGPDFGWRSDQGFHAGTGGFGGGAGAAAAAAADAAGGVFRAGVVAVPGPELRVRAGDVEAGWRAVSPAAGEGPAGRAAGWTPAGAGSGGCRISPRCRGAALSRGRGKLGLGPVRALFGQVAGPTGADDAPGVFCRGLRVVSMDGSVTDVPDSEANGEFFGRPSNQTRDGAFPRVRSASLIPVPPRRPAMGPPRCQPADQARPSPLTRRRPCSGQAVRRTGRHEHAHRSAGRHQRIAAVLRRGARLGLGRAGLAGWLAGDYRMAVRSETRPAMARWVSS